MTDMHYRHKKKTIIFSNKNNTLEKYRADIDHSFSDIYSNMYIVVCLLLYMFNHAFAIPAVQTNPLNEVSQEARNQTDVDGDPLLKDIKDLERQKNDLYKEINKAIDESITALNKSTDTDAVIGVNYIKDLKKQMKEFNDTEDKADVIYNKYEKSVNDTFLGTTNNQSIFLYEMENGTSIDPRRRMKHIERSKQGLRQMAKNYDSEKFLKDAQKELDLLLNKGTTGEKLKERLERREKIRLQLQEWIKMKDLEKDKIRQYKDKQKNDFPAQIQELCPRSGYSKQKSKNKKGDHPCCRKCCKKSYLGCLKK